MAVNILLSYAFHADNNLDIIRRDLVCGQLMIDSGAFTAWSSGAPVDLRAYARFLTTWRNCWDHAITLDVIGDHNATRVNTHRLHEMGLPVMPVFTRGDNLANFDAMVREHRYVCVGGLVGLPIKAQRDRAAMLQRRAARLGGGIHALGIGSMATLRQARPYSADASTVSGAFKFGNVVYFTGGEVRATQITDRAKLHRDWEHIRAHGIDLGLLTRLRKMPRRAEGRPELMRAMSLAYACADEVLKRQYPVSAPTGHPDGPHLFSSVIGQGGQSNSDVHQVCALDRLLHDGPHLYNSVPTKELVTNWIDTDPALHGGWNPPIWATYGRHHTCHRERTPVDAS